MKSADFENLLKQTMGLEAATIGRSSVERAVRVRMEHIGVQDIEDYWHQVCDSREELQELIEGVVVPETWFFRDREAFSALVHLIAETWRSKHAGEVLRLLSIPCSTGEEPYSMLMAMLDAGFAPEQIQVEAVDISARALIRARRGEFGRNSFRGDNLAFCDRHFHSTSTGLAVKEALRDKVKFRQGNLIAPHFHEREAQYDAVFCRNLLIYFDRPTQERVMRTLDRLLAPDGFLFVGPAEAFLASSSGFCPVNQSMSFAFRRRPQKHDSTDGAVQSKKKNLINQARPGIETKVSRKGSCTEAERAHSSSKPTNLETARRMADLGEFREATELCERYLRNEGSAPEGFYLLGLVRDAAGDRKRAGDCYRKVIYLEPTHVEALLHLALLVESDGDFDTAKRLKERARRAAGSAAQR